MIRIVVCAAAWLVASPAAALAVEVAKSVEVAAPPEKVWEAIGDFCGIGAWHPAVKSCEPSFQDGREIRTLTLEGGGKIVEAELARSDEKMNYSYTILDSPLPVSGYTSVIAVTPGGKGSRVTWFGTFVAKDVPDAKAEAVIAGIYDAGLAVLARTSK